MPAVQSTGGRAAEDDDFDQPPRRQALLTAQGSHGKVDPGYHAIGRASKRLSEGQVEDRCAEVSGVAPRQS